MKKILITTLCSSLLSSYGMNGFSNSDFAPNGGGKNLSQTLSPISKDSGMQEECIFTRYPGVTYVVESAGGEYKLNEFIKTETNKLSEEDETDECTETESIIEVQVQHKGEVLSKETLRFFDNLSPELFLDSSIDHTGWTKQPEEFYVTLVLGRHVGDKNNLEKKAHTSSGHSEINIQTVGIEKAMSLITMGTIFKFDAIAGGTSDRHATTARLIASASRGERKYRLLKEFDEQRLGHLGGKHEKEILENSEFIRMFNNLNYKMRKDNQEEDENAESGAEVIDRFKRGVNGLIQSVFKSRKKNLQLTEADPQQQEKLFEQNMLLYICTSRCTLNWMIKYFTGDMDLPLQLKTIQNCNLFCVNYYPFRTEDKYQVLKTDAANDNMPYCISPLHFIHFALKSPVFDPFVQEFHQRVSRTIQKKDKVSVATTISRSNSFSEGRSISQSSGYTEQNSISDKGRYIESAPVSRGDSFRSISDSASFKSF